MKPNDLLNAQIAKLESENSALAIKHKNTKDILFNAIQLLIDVTDPDCPESFKEVVKGEILELKREYFNNY
jgi:hypothetical protein